MSLIDDVAQYLDDEGVAVLSTNLFKSHLPDSVNDCMVVLDTGGPSPDVDLPTKSPTFQIFIRASDYTTGRALLDSVRAKLHQKANLRLISDGTYFYYILAQSEGGHLGKNERGLDEFSINFLALTR